MKPCLREGTLQSYLDGELPDSAMRCAAGHLEICAACRDRLAALEAVSSRVTEFLGLLAEGGQPPVALSLPSTGWTRMRWAEAILVPLAAAAFWLVSAALRQAPPLPPVAKVEPAAAVERVVSVPDPPVIRPPARRMRKTAKALSDTGLDGFLQLDTAPFQTGMVVRVMLPASDVAVIPQSTDAQLVAADLLIGEDGRARAIRFVE